MPLHASCIYNSFCTDNTLSLPAPPAYDDVVERQSYNSSLQQPAVTNVSHTCVLHFPIAVVIHSFSINHCYVAS